MKFILLMILLVTKTSIAQESLTLDQAVNEALTKSPEIQRAKSAATESDWRATESLGGGFLPKLSAGAHHYFDSKYSETTMLFGGAPLTFPGFYPTDTASVDLQIPIFDGLANIRNLQAANLNKDAAKAELSFAEFTLKQQIRLAFYQALAAVQLQQVTVENVKTLDDHLKQTNVQKRGGVATNYDLLRVQVQLSDAQTDAVDAADSVVTTRKKLTELLGLEDDSRPLQGTLPEPDQERIANLKWSETPKERADIQALNLRAEAAGRAHQASEGWLIPAISLQGEYMWYNQQYFAGSVEDTGHFQNAYNVGVFLSWNLYDGGVSYARERESLERKFQAQKTAQSKTIQVPYDFEYWKRRYSSNTNKYKAKQLDIQRSQESVRLAKEEEKAGTRTSTETLDAELDLFRSRAGVVNALINALEAQIQLENALGKEL